MGNLEAIETGAAQVDAGTRCQLGDPHREPRIQDPVPVRRGQTLQQRLRSHGTNDVYRLAPGRQLAVLPRENDARKVLMMIDMEVREGDVRDLLPRYAELREPPSRAGATVHQQLRAAGFDVVRGTAPVRGERYGARAENRQQNGSIPTSSEVLRNYRSAWFSVGRWRALRQLQRWRARKKVGR